jgi:hypothetical protein
MKAAKWAARSAVDRNALGVTTASGPRKFSRRAAYTAPSNGIRFPTSPLCPSSSEFVMVGDSGSMSRGAPDGAERAGRRIDARNTVFTLALVGAGSAGRSTPFACMICTTAGQSTVASSARRWPARNGEYMHWPAHRSRNESPLRNSHARIE